MKTLRPRDTITGSSGKGTIIVNGERRHLLDAIDIEAKIEKTKKDIPIMGRKSMGNKSTGAKLTGKMKLYYVSSYFRKMMIEYVKTGKDVYFDMLVENEDTDSATGRQAVMLKGVNINSVIIAKYDANSTELDEDIDFTFEDVELLEGFDEVEGEDLGGI